MNRYLSLVLIAISIMAVSSCLNNGASDSEIEKIYNRAKENHRTSRDSIEYYLTELLKYDTLQLSELSLARIHHIRGLFYETQLKYDSAASVFSYGASLIGDNSLKATLLLRAASDASRVQDYDRFNQLMIKAEKLVEKLGDPIHEAAFESNKGDYNIGIDNYENAIPHYLKADSILEANDILRTRDYYCYRVGLAYRRLSKYPQAFEYLKKSIALSTQLNNTYRLAHNYIDLSRMYRSSQRYDEALKWQEKHLELAHEIEDLAQVQKGLENMGIISAETKEWDKAESYFMQALETAYEINDPSSIGDALSNTGNFYYRRGNLEKAFNYYKQSYAYRKEHYNTPLAILSSLYHLGDVDLARGNFASAETHLQRAVSLADSANQSGWAVTTSKRLADLYKSNGDYNKYTDALEQYVKAKDRWNTELQNTNFNKLTVQYETKQKETTIALQAEQLKSSRQLQIIIGISFLFLLFFTSAVFINKKVRMRTFRAIYRQQLLVNDQQKVISSLLKKTATLKPRETDSKLLVSLKDLLEKEEIFKNPEVSLEMVAKELGTNITYASKLVNGQFNCNFNTLINRYRIDYCKECIRDGYGNATMKSLGLQAGFKSQSAFYASFKDSVGMTPLQFAKVSRMEVSIAS